MILRIMMVVWESVEIHQAEDHVGANFRAKTRHVCWVIIRVSFDTEGAVSCRCLFYVVTFQTLFENFFFLGVIEGVLRDRFPKNSFWAIFII